MAGASTGQGTSIDSSPISGVGGDTLSGSGPVTVGGPVGNAPPSFLSTTKMVVIGSVVLGVVWIAKRAK